MKEKVKAEYHRKVTKVLQTKLNGGNIIKEIKAWAASLQRYSAVFIDWNSTELTQIDRRTGKLMTTHNALHSKSNLDHLYIPREEGGRGFQCIEETVKLAKLGLGDYVRNSRQRLLTAARSVNIDLIQPIQESNIEAKKQ